MLENISNCLSRQDLISLATKAYFESILGSKEREWRYRTFVHPPPPFCYWWLSWKNATESFSYGNPNPRGVRKCNSTNKILYFLWKMCGKWIYTSHIAEEKFYSFFAFICRLKPNKRNVQLCYLSFIWHFSY